MNKKYYISIKEKKYIDNIINDLLIFKDKNLDSVKEILLLNNKYQMLIKSNN